MVANVGNIRAAQDSIQKQLAFLCRNNLAVY
jgi:hypothetical protein